MCGAGPLLVGTAIFVAFILTGWAWLMIVGAFVLYGGLAVFAIGMSALGYSWWTLRRSPDIPRRRVRLSILATAALLLVNFPVAAAILWLVITMATRYTVIVHNTSPETLERVWVFGGGCDVTYGTMPAGSTARRSFWIQGDGTLRFRASSGDRVIEQEIESYVTVNSGGHADVTVGPDYRVSVLQGARNLTVFDRIRATAVGLDRSPCLRFEGAS
jgi:hypothetical protein